MPIAAGTSVTFPARLYTERHCSCRWLFLTGTVPWTHQHPLQHAQPHPEPEPVLVSLPRSVQDECTELSILGFAAASLCAFPHGRIVYIARADADALCIPEPSAFRHANQLAHGDSQHGEDSAAAAGGPLGAQAARWTRVEASRVPLPAGSFNHPHEGSIAYPDPAPKPGTLYGVPRNQPWICHLSFVCPRSSS